MAKNSTIEVLSGELATTTRFDSFYRGALAPEQPDALRVRTREKKNIQIVKERGEG
jgi:hypothetical protein